MGMVDSKIQQRDDFRGFLDIPPERRFPTFESAFDSISDGIVLNRVSEMSLSRLYTLLK